MKSALITDTHMGARNNCENFNNYFFDFFLNQFFPYLEENNITTILHLGDLGEHKKHCSNYILDLWNKNIFSRLKEYHCYFLSGNHDIYFKHNNSITLQSSLELDKRFGINLITSSPKTYQFDNISIDFIPWISSSNRNEISEFIEHSNSNILVGHLETKGARMSPTELCTESHLNTDSIKKYKWVLSGHFHIPSQVGNIKYIGNPYQIIWSDYNSPRGFSVLDTETLDIEFIPNKKTIFEKLILKEHMKFNSIDFSIYENKHVLVIIPENISKSLLTKVLNKFENIQTLSLTTKESHYDVSLDSNETTLKSFQNKDTLNYINEYTNEIFNKSQINLNMNRVLQTLSSIYNDALRIKS